jgi:hypothetical protein
MARQLLIHRVGVSMKKILLFLVLIAIGIDAARTEVFSQTLSQRSTYTLAKNEEGASPVDEVMVTPSPYEQSYGAPPSETPYDENAKFKKTDRSDNPYNGADKRPSSE